MEKLTDKSTGLYLVSVIRMIRDFFIIENLPEIQKLIN